jgi:hypothetical protein
MTERIIGDLRNEREKQETRYGEYTKYTSPLSSDNIIVIVTQLGEASNSLNYLTMLRNSGASDEETVETLKAAYRKKLISVAACAVRTIEQLDSVNLQSLADS